MPKNLPAAVLIGRPNVGKSTLFNRITGVRRAIVAPLPGTTRDVISDAVEWRGVWFELTDTGGMFGASEDPLRAMVSARGRQAAARAAVIVIVADGSEGVTPADEEVAAAARATGKPVVLAVNKSDAARSQAGALEFHRLGFEPIVVVSAEHGLGIGELLDEIVRHAQGRSAASAAGPAADRVLTEAPREEAAGTKAADTAGETAVAIVGRPNVGKSSLVNCLLREERVLVSDMPGTTRDAVETALRWHRRRFRIVDTAGIRRPGAVARAGAVEQVSAMQARRAID
ncbi:MAG TPA: 50S ribosome-binding GTPase, partial [Vicinamibacterales bacterium]|nr:50S ribosome-binding GTPase [Vicinamibacterales bacterium]